MQTKYILTTMLLVLSSVTHLLSASYIWTGTSSSNWNTAGNWSSGIIPGVADFITLNSNAPNNLVLDQNRTVANFTINGDTLDLGTYTLTTTGVTYFNGGLVSNGNLNISGSLCHFGGATINARIEASCGYYHMNGGVFLKPVVLVSSGTSNTTGTGSNIFEDSLTITHSGVFYFTMGSSTNDFLMGL
ncbi:MAG: hypothetical protein IPP71_01700 [Bacteroidetes bacterium]|nr:hypothetical protein [Bacteroidota bacterium]